MGAKGISANVSRLATRRRHDLGRQPSVICRFRSSTPIAALQESLHRTCGIVVVHRLRAQVQACHDARTGWRSASVDNLTLPRGEPLTPLPEIFRTLPRPVRNLTDDL